MQKSFWQKLKKPFFALAPMANVTDAAFRLMLAKYGKPDVLFTEFVSADGLVSVGRERLLPDLWFTDAERPIVAQLFGANPEKMRKAATLVRELGFDGLDINMGCPDRGVERQGAGAALMKNPALAEEIIAAAKTGASPLPISIKTRIGYHKVEFETFLPTLFSCGIAALTVHLRTRKEMSKVPAHWELLPQIAKLRDKLAPKTLLIGNGDVETLEEGKEKALTHRADGIMIGRGIFNNHAMFSNRDMSLRERLTMMLEHTKLFEELFTDVKSFDVMKKHYKAYVQGFPKAAELRGKLMECKDAGEVEFLLIESGII